MPRIPLSSLLTLALLSGLFGCSSDSSTSVAPTGTGGTGASGTPEVTGTMPEGAVFPTDETVEAGEYTPLSRPLYLYVSKASLQKPAVAAYLQYYLSDEGQQLVADVGYVRLNQEQLAATRQTLEDAIAAAGTSLGSELSGDVVIDGSSTVQPISAAVAEEFSTEHPDVRVPVGTSGTGSGFKIFARGDSDISDASRPIKDSEIEALNAAGIEYVELKIAIDGLTVVVHPENDWVSGMTAAQLKQIWEPESKVTKWSEVNPEWPDEPINLYGPGTASGTFDYFTEAIVGESGASRADYQQSEDDNVLVTGVAGDPYALGYFGYAYYVSNKEQLKALAIAP